jgi:hypothetical protein
MKCKEIIYVGTWALPSHCSRNASTTDGYCKQHDLANVKKRQEERNAQWKKEANERLKVSRLHAAAPELLEAAEAALDRLEVHGEGDSDYFPATATVKALREAIAKAKGEGKSSL